MQRTKLIKTRKPMIRYKKPCQERENRNSTVRIIKPSPGYQRVKALEQKSALHAQPESNNVNKTSTIKINREGEFLVFQDDGGKFFLSQFKIRLILKNLKELKEYWSLPIVPYEQYNIQPAGREWRINRIPGWKLSYILNHVDAINKLFIRSFRLTNMELSTIKHSLAEIYVETKPFEIPDSRPPLYRWQQEALDKWVEGKRGIIEAATGTGKTRLACECISNFFSNSPEGLVCIIVPRQPLFNQWQEELFEYFSGTPQANYAYQGNGYDDSIQWNTQILITTQQTMVLNEDSKYGCSLIKNLINTGRDVLIVVDEAHHLAGKNTLERFVKYVPAYFYTLGLTATPIRRDGMEKEVYKYFDCETSEKPIYSYPISKAVEEGTLSQVKQFNFSVSFNEGEHNRHRNYCDQIKNLKNKIINNTVFEVNKNRVQIGDIEYLTRLETYLQKLQYTSSRAIEIGTLIDQIRTLDTLYVNRRRLFNKAESKWDFLATMLKDGNWRKRFNNGRWIFFHQEIDECERTAYLLGKALGRDKIRLHHSGIFTKERDQLLVDFEKSQFNCLCAVQTLDEGIDIPELQGVVIVSGSTSSRQQIQRCGRALRLAPHKEYAYLVSILAQADEDLTGEKLLIGPTNNTKRWEITNFTFKSINANGINRTAFQTR